MELSCALHFSHGHLRIEKMTKLVAEAGYDALDVSPWISVNLMRDSIKRLNVSLKRNNLGFSGFLAIYPPEMSLTSSSSTIRKKNIRYTRQLVDVAHNLGGKTIVWGSGVARSIPRTVPFRDGLNRLTQLLKTSCSLADERDIKIAIEPLNRFESNVIHSMKEALSLADTINHRSACVIYDTFHASIEEDSFIDPILRAGKRLAAVHIADCNRKIPSEGHIDFQPIFDALKKVRYNGYVTLEAILNPNPVHDLVSARKYMEKMIS